MVDKGLLIELVRERVALWDQREKQYHNRDLRGKLWEEIGKLMKIDGNHKSINYKLTSITFKGKFFDML